MNLTLDNVSYTYPKSPRPALNCLSFTFGPGQMYAVVGPSGSGKSTLLSLLAGLDLPTEGAVMLNGESLASMDLDRYRRESVSMIFQSFHLLPLMTIAENVAFPLTQQGLSMREAKKKAAFLLERVGISKELHDRFPAKLSGGEQQRVAVARAMASGARILLADEPTGNLDRDNSERVVRLMTGLAHEEGYCVIVVTHDMELAARADQVLTLRDGELS